MRAARGRLEHLRALSAAEVDRFPMAAVDAEAIRCAAEDHRSATRESRRTEEAAHSATHTAAVQLRWAALYDTRVPQELHAELDEQRAACDRIIHAKDRLIQEYQQELWRQDEEYVKALKRQTEDIDQLIDVMHHQTNAFAAAYEQELEAIGVAFLADRGELLERTRGDITTLLEQRRTRELQQRKGREDHVEEEHTKWDRMYDTHAEQSTELKAKLHKEIQGLESQLGDMRALYRLNAEKVEYNLRVLGERVKENEKVILGNKRKSARLQDVLSGLITKYAEVDRRFQTENATLTEQYQRCAEQSKDLQLKSRYFELADARQHRRVFAMHAREVRELAAKCVQADRVLFEQQLGMPWKAPPIDCKYEELDGLADDEGPPCKQIGDEVPPQAADAGAETDRLLAALESQCGFLSATVGVPQEGAGAVAKIDAILKVLGIEGDADVAKLLTFCQKPPGADNHTMPLVDGPDVVAAVRRFLEERQKTAAAPRDNAATALKAQSNLRRQAERDFYARMTAAVPEAHFAAWTDLESGLEKYVGVLQDRARLLTETEGLRRQNAELHALLDGYLTAPIRDELYYPPRLSVDGLQVTHKIDYRR